MLWVILHIWLHQPNSSELCNLSGLGQEFRWQFLKKLPSNLIFNAICQPTDMCLRSTLGIQVTSKNTFLFTGLNTLMRDKMKYILDFPLGSVFPAFVHACFKRWLAMSGSCFEAKGLLESLWGSHLSPLFYGLSVRKLSWYTTPSSLLPT